MRYDLIILIIIITESYCKFGSRNCELFQHNINSNNGLIFYDIKTNQTLLPPVVTSENYLPFLRLPKIGLPCTCQSTICGCCAGMNLQQFNNHFCTNITYDPMEFSLTMDFLMNENSLYQNSFSAKNPPPVCIPIPVPYIPIRMEMCVKFFNIFQVGSNLHMCLDMIAKIERAPIIVLHFDCMRMGQDGLILLKPGDNGGTFGVDTTINMGISSPIDNQINQGYPIDPIQPPQEDYDTYDEITEIKHD